jgi:hypothetical protein
MEQRPLRLGDIVDDYCPRERRITDHAVVAMIDDAIKQTRCTACDAEHPYKDGKAPRRKKAATTGRLYKEVLAGITEPDAAHAAALEAGEAAPDEDVTPVHQSIAEPPDAVVVELTADATSGDAPEIGGDTAEEEPEMPILDEGPVHRPLIRATLPRPDGVKVERPIPDFTIRHNGNGRPHGNGNQFRDARGGGKSRGNGQGRFNRGPGGARQGRGGGFGGGRQGNGGGSRRRGR